jgi:hypothetical protein
MNNKHNCAAWLFTFGLGALLGPRWQDPAPKPTAPAAPPTTPPALTSASSIESPGARQRHPTEGVYALRRRVVGARVEGQPAAGYLAITGRHLFLSVAAPGPDPGKPLLRAAVRSWQQDRDLTKLTVLNGWLTDGEGKVVVERPGHEEMRGIELIQGGLRIKQDERNWLEFERIE